ncbi:hypothetical protein D3C79_1110420 [compost metagenome]
MAFQTANNIIGAEGILRLQKENHVRTRQEKAGITGRCRITAHFIFMQARTTVGGQQAAHFLQLFGF